MHHSTKYPLQVYSSLTLASHLKALQKQAKTPNGVQLRRKKVRLKSNQTWKLCPRPSHKNVITNKWVYKVKQRGDGTIEKLKAFLVVRDYKQ